MVANAVKPAGGWASVYTQSEASVNRLTEFLITDWKRKLTPQAAVATVIGELQSFRHAKDLKDIALLAACYEHWLQPLVKGELGIQA